MKFIVCICFLDVELDLVLSFGKEVHLSLRIVFEYLAYFSGSVASQSDFEAKIHGKTEELHGSPS